MLPTQANVSKMGAYSSAYSPKEKTNQNQTLFKKASLNCQDVVIYAKGDNTLA